VETVVARKNTVFRKTWDACLHGWDKQMRRSLYHQSMQPAKQPEKEDFRETQTWPGQEGSATNVGFERNAQ
jgi:hypothetical protein